MAQYRCLLSRITTYSIKVFILISQLLISTYIYAGCVTPLGPTITSNDGITTLHSYTNGSAVCIHKFDKENSCEHCKQGFIHECSAGWWKPTGIDCSAQNAITKAGRNPYLGPKSNEEPSSEQSKPKDKEDSQRKKDINKEELDKFLKFVLSDAKINAQNRDEKIKIQMDINKIIKAKNSFDTDVFNAGIEVIANSSLELQRAAEQEKRRSDKLEKTRNQNKPQIQKHDDPPVNYDVESPVFCNVYTDPFSREKVTWVDEGCK